MERNTLSKAERLCSKLQIDRLFAGGSKSFSIYPLRVVFGPMAKQEEAPAAILVSVSKKRFKRAVKRNRIKRQVREAYRKNKHELLLALEGRTEGMAIAFIYLSNAVFPTDEMEQKMKTILARIVERSV